MLHDPGPSPGWFSGKDEGVEGESARQRMEQALTAAHSAGTHSQTQIDPLSATEIFFGVIALSKSYRFEVRG